MFLVRIGNPKVSDTNDINPHATGIKYKQNNENTCVISSQASSLFAANDFFGKQAVTSRIILYFSSSLDRIQFSVDIITQHVINKVEQRSHYKLKHWNSKVSFDILHYICYNVTLVQLQDTSRNANNTVSVSGYWIFDSNYKQSLPLFK